MKVKTSILGILAFASSIITIASAESNSTFCDQTLNYCLTTSKDFNNAKWRESVGASGMKADHMASNIYSVDSDQHTGIEIYHLDASCPPDDFGVRELMEQQEENGATMMWGRVSYFDHMLQFDPSGHAPDCRPPELIYEPDGWQKNEAAAYSFCAEKEGKTVLICVSQMKKDPALASQIFSSFRWLDPTDLFHDTPATHPQADAIAYVKNEGIVSGYEDGTFRPDALINRAEFTKIVLGGREGSQEKLGNKENRRHCFPDVADQWFAPYVCSAKEEGIIGGYEDGTFRPANTINFAEAAKIVAESFDVPMNEEGAISPWYKPYLDALSGRSAIPSSITSPEQEITRGEMSEIIYRLRISH